MSDPNIMTADVSGTDDVLVTCSGDWMAEVFRGLRDELEHIRQQSPSATAVLVTDSISTVVLLERILHNDATDAQRQMIEQALSDRYID